MTEYTFAQMAAGAFTEKLKRHQTLIAQQATNDLLKNIPIKAGVTRGGTREIGSIPRMDGAIARSLQSSLYGSTSIQRSGEASFAMVIGAMKAGDVAQFTWGGAAAPHARANHYGTKGMSGTFWIIEAVEHWQKYVDAAAARVITEIV